MSRREMLLRRRGIRVAAAPAALGFHDLDEWLVDMVSSGHTSNPGYPDTSSSDWHSNLAFDDSAWTAKANGCGSTGSDAASPDGREMTGNGGTHTAGIHWNSEITPNAVYRARARFNVDSSMTTGGATVRLTWGARMGAQVFINGTQVGSAAGSNVDSVGQTLVNITSYCSIGENLLAIGMRDWNYSAFGDPYQGLALDAHFWALIE